MVQFQNKLNDRKKKPSQNMKSPDSVSEFKQLCFHKSKKSGDSYTQINVETLTKLCNAHRSTRVNSPRFLQLPRVVRLARKNKGNRKLTDRNMRFLQQAVKRTQKKTTEFNRYLNALFNEL